jgi:hypothetical protein
MKLTFPSQLETIRRNVLRNMHLGGYGVNYDEWLADQPRYARCLHRSGARVPAPR